MDSEICALTLIKKWVKYPFRKNLIFRIAVQEIEAWLLADTEGFSRFLNLENAFVKKEIDIPDEISNPKEKLISLVKRSRRNELKKDIIREEFTSLKQGPGYNTRLIEFLYKYWDINRAMARSNSLYRAIVAINNFNEEQSL